VTFDPPFRNCGSSSGHLGEALPFWLFRLDYMHRASVAAKRYASMPPLRKSERLPARKRLW